MSPPFKKMKIVSQPAKSSSVLDELQMFQNEIHKIKSSTTEQLVAETVPDEHNYDISPVITQPSKYQENEHKDDEIKKIIRDQVLTSENRIQLRLDKLEQKLNRLLECLLPGTEEDIPEEHLLEFAEENEETQHLENDEELDRRIFPITDEATFDWFFERLRDGDYRESLISRRWQLTRTVSTKSFNISVKDFLRLHFELTVCIKYSVSGYGAHGTKKKKFDSHTLTVFVFECFNRSQSNVHSFQEVNKAIVQFWGRCPDTLNKAIERAVKHEPI